jgi:hypothetical protein
MMPAYRCRSHDRSDCRDAVCRRQAERAGLVTPPAPRGTKAAGGATAVSVRTARSKAVAAARAGELWLGPAEDIYGSSGQTRGSVAHLPGGVCVDKGQNPDESGLYAGWGRVDGVPSAVQELISGNPVLATDDSGLIAARLCTACRTLLG